MSVFSQRADEVRQRAASGAPPKLPVSYINVRPLNGAVVYTIEGAPIPADQWSTVPVSAGVINAIKFGDLEEGEVAQQPSDEPQADQRHRSHRRRAEEA